MASELDETQLAYLHRQISDRLITFHSEANSYSKKSKYYQASAVIIGALITVLSGLKLPLVIRGYSTDKFALGITALILVLGASSTVIAFFGSFFSPAQCWRLNQDTYNKMRALQAEIEMEELSPTFSDHEEALLKRFFAKYQSILDEQNRQWLEIRSRK
jgi:hypothetical protein